MKSVDIPESNDGPVKVVVGKQFKEIVMDETKDVLIEFYAPCKSNLILGCGHCKSLMPIWESLGASELGANIVIAKMDATENDMPTDVDFEIQGFPTIVLFKANDNERIVFDGARDLKGFQMFLKTSAVNGNDVQVSLEDADDDEDDEKTAETEEAERDEL